MKSHRSHRRSPAYTLVELTVAMGIILAGVAAAAALTMNTNQLEDINYRKGRALSVAEGAARLWQLGLSPADCRTLLLGDPGVADLTFNAQAGDPATVAPHNAGAPVSDPAADLGSFEQMTIRVTVRTREAAPGNNPPAVTQQLPPLVVIRGPAPTNHLP